MALGARREDVVAMIVRQGLGLGLPGVALGIAGALLLTRFIDHMLYEVTPTDPITFAQVALLILVVAALASYLPARRAARTDPVRTLRDE